MQQRAVIRNCTSVCDVERAVEMVLLLDCIFVFMELIGFLIVANVYFEKRFHGKKGLSGNR